MEIVHPSLTNAWRVNSKNEMCWIFDETHPPRQFNRNVLYSPEAEPPIYGPGPPWSYLTETDEENKLAQYAPRIYQ